MLSYKLHPVLLSSPLQEQKLQRQLNPLQNDPSHKWFIIFTYYCIILHTLIQYQYITPDINNNFP